MYESMEKIWDERKGKYVEPFTKKKIKILPYLYLEGNKLYWGFPKPPEFEHTEEEIKEEVRRSVLLEKDLDAYLALPPPEHLEREIEHWNNVKRYNMQKYLNMVLRILPLIPVSGFLLGYGVI